MKSTLPYDEGTWLDDVEIHICSRTVDSLFHEAKLLGDLSLLSATPDGFALSEVVYVAIFRNFPSSGRIRTCVPPKVDCLLVWRPTWCQRCLLCVTS